MLKLRTVIAGTVLSGGALYASMGPAGGTPDAGKVHIPSVPEAWSPEGRAPYTPPSAGEAWSPEGREAAD